MAFSVGTLIGYLELQGGQKFTAGTRAAQESLDLTAKTAVKAGAAIDKTGAALVGAGRQADVAAAGTNRLKAAELSLVAAQERYNKVTADSTATTGRLASSQAALLRAQDRVRASQPITPAAVAQVGAMQTKIRSLLGDTVKMAAGFAVLGGIFELGNAIKQANDFQRQMLLIQTQAGASATEVKTMTQAVLGLSGQVATGPEQLATSLYHVESVGLRGAKALDVVRIAAEGAKIGNADLEQTTNALTSTVASGIPGVQNMAQAMGMLNATVGSGDMKLSDLNEALGGGILSVVKNYGLSLADVGAALATFGDNNIRGADAATMLRMAVQAMAHPAAEGAKQLDLLGLKTDTLAKDMQTGGLNKAILDLQAHLKAAGDTGVKEGAVLTDVFGKRAGPGLAVLLGQVDRLESKYGAITKGAQSFGSAWDATTKTASFGFDKLKASAESAGISIFSKVGPAVGQVASDVGVVLPAAFHALGAALTPVGVALGAVAHLLQDSGGAAHFIASALHDLEPLLKTVGAAAVAMWLGFKAGELVVGVVRAVQSAVETMALKALYAKDAILAFGTAQGTAAAESAAAGAVIAGSAEETSATVVASGEAAEAGWAGLAGPIGAAVVGIGVIIAMFHKSSGASKEATDAAKAYTDALKSGSSGDVTNSIVAQLTKNNVPEAIAALNKQLGATRFSGAEFVNAIQRGGPALDQLRDKLHAVIDAETPNVAIRGGGTVVQARTAAAKKLLSDLNAQNAGLSAAAAKEISDFKAFGTVATSIDTVSAASEVGSQTAQTYAQMLGIVVDKNGVAAVSSDVLNKAIKTVSDAYGTATQTGSEFLTALNAFSQSAGTAADRAALIGATLKASNGDALGFAGTMNGLAQATSTFATDMASGAKTANEHLKTYVNSLYDAKTGTINFNRAAAGPMITDLQSIQTAAMNAAGGIYQHNLAMYKAAGATNASTKASDDAVATYKQMTSGALTNYLKSIGDVNSKTGKLTTSAQKLVDTYFSMPKDIKTLIEQEGANPVVTVLNQIGTQLSFLTGHPWNPKVSVDPGPALTSIQTIKNALGQLPSAATLGTKSLDPRLGAVRPASGGFITGPGSGTSDSIPARLSNGEFVVKASQTAKHRNLLHAINAGAQGFAEGGTVGDFTIPAGSNAASSPAKKAKITMSSISITAGGGAAYGIADLIKGNIAQSRFAMRDLSAAVNEAFQLKGVQSKLATVQAGLKQLVSDANQLRASVEGTLSSSVDVSKYADMGGLLSALGGGTAANTKFAGELNKLKGEGASTTLLQQLAQAGPSAGLDTLAGASATDARKAFGAFNSYISSANLGGNAAYSGVYGARIAADQKNVATLTKQQIALSNGITKLVGAIGHLTNRPVDVTLNGHVIATAVVKDSAFDGALNEITHQMLYGT